MIYIVSLHIRLNRMLLLAVGLWPYQRTKLVKLQLIFLLGILATFIIFQLTTFMTVKCTPNLVIDVFSSVSIYLAFMIIYSSFSINIKVVKHLLEQLQHICNELTDENEISIIKQYASYAYRYTAIFIAVIIFIAFVLILNPFWSLMFDILPINGSRSRSPLLFGSFVTEYFIDQERYFYLIFVHANAAFFIGGMAMITTGALLLVYEQHACGMFRIVSYRIEQAITRNILRKNSLGNKNRIYMRLIYAVDMHRKAMKFSDSSVSKFKIMFFFLIVVGVTCGSLNFFQIFQAVSFGYDVEKFSLPVIYVIVLFLYVFIGNYIGQEVMDHNNDIFATAYNIQWYIAPLRVQKMILLLLQRSSKIFSLNIAGLFVGSLECAATLLSAMVSYFTVLYSTRH